MPRVLLVGNPASDDVRSLLEQAGFPVTVTGLSGIDPSEVARSQLVVVEVTPQTTTTAQAVCRRWRIELGEHYVPIIWLCFENNPTLFAGGLDAGADVCLARPVIPEHWIGQVKALLRIQHMNSRLTGRAAEAALINQRLQQAYQQIDSDLELTRRIHRSFLPRSLPEVHQTSFAVCYRPRSRVGGDFYDAFRLDEENAVVYVADAMGRGLPASSLLSIFVKKSIEAKEITGRSYRLVPPNEVLSKLNRELAGLGLAEPPFVTMLYMQINCRDGGVVFARAGHPNPLWVPSEGEPVYWHALGTMLGVVEADYASQTQQLRAGDKVLLFTDGVHPPGSEGTTDPLIEAVKLHRHLPLQNFVDQVARELLERSRHPEDFTLLGIEYLNPAAS
jgi:serine phosphatase RsbU (regulator of sigma subunit)